jgi:hypothetical protein
MNGTDQGHLLSLVTGSDHYGIMSKVSMSRIVFSDE